jgi:hypothetical protein
MKQSINLDNLSLKELSISEKQNTMGGNSQVTFKDNEGYTWVYDYNDKGDLISYGVYRGTCVNLE